MYWVTITMMGIANYFFHRGKTLGSFKNKEGNKADLPDDRTDPITGEEAQGNEQQPSQKDEKKWETEHSSQEDEKTLETESDPWQRHLIYVHEIENAYRNRRSSMDDRIKAIDLSTQYIAEFDSLKPAVFENIQEDPRIIPVFKMLTIMYEEEEVFDQAIDICRTALAHGIEDGTKTGFEGRIERLMKKQEDKDMVF
ncbi:MAG: hypothetical protein R6U68_04625 [Desulfobacteraceae bacterium]